mgnify:CR=1 FL=1
MITLEISLDLKMKKGGTCNPTSTNNGIPSEISHRLSSDIFHDKKPTDMMQSLWENPGNVIFLHSPT